MASTPETTRKAAKILVVEDSPTQLEKLRFLLDESGYCVVAATNGKQGFAAAKANAIDLVLSDIVMPEMDGYELCKALRADETLKHLPVILLTSLADPRDVIRGLESGANNFICKPYHDRELLARVQSVLANQEIRKGAPSEMGISVYFAGQRFLITADRLQILDLLLSTYENSVNRNDELIRTRDELRVLNEQLEQRVAERTAALTAKIEERRRAEKVLLQRSEELARSNAELEQFAYVASHDLQEPLRMVASYTQLLAERYHGKLDADADEFIEFAVAGARRMQELILDLLAYGRIGTRGHEFRMTSSEAALSAALQNLGLAIRESDAVIRSGPLPTVWADSVQLQQVFQNLLGNAIKFRHSRRPEIQVSGEESGAEWHFCVADNGIGIEPQHADQIFQVFHQLHAREEYPGTGIGLPICKKIAERHGGRIWVESQPGHGATFHFTISKSGSEAPC
jgi:signal transduction histidine kinase